MSHPYWSSALLQNPSLESQKNDRLLEFTGGENGKTKKEHGEIVLEAVRLLM
jgi:hypothetical protein